MKAALRGNPFIEEVNAPSSLRNTIDRTCDNCFYRHDSIKLLDDCKILLPEEEHPKTLFGIKKGEKLPMQLDGEEVGHYCPRFLNYNAD